jgi:hypothetical protein
MGRNVSQDEKKLKYSAKINGINLTAMIQRRRLLAPRSD